MQLNEGKQAQVGANGRAVVTLQPLRAGENWKVTHHSISNTGTVLTPEERLYRGIESPTTLLEGTFSGNMDSSDTVIDVRNGEALLFIWTGADVGSFCTATVTGERTIG